MFYRTVYVFFEGKLTKVDVPCHPNTPIEEVKNYGLIMLQKKKENIIKKRNKLAAMMYYGIEI